MTAQTHDEHVSDHDLLIRIDQTVSALKSVIEHAGIPATCATHEQEHRANNARIRTMETRMWAVVMVVIAAIITGGIGLLFRQ
jgi:hypothetical protein